MLFRVHYIEQAYYEEFIEAEDTEEAYSKFYNKLANDHIQPTDVDLIQYECDPVTEESHK